MVGMDQADMESIPNSKYAVRAVHNVLQLFLCLFWLLFVIFVFFFVWSRSK